MMEWAIKLNLALLFINVGRIAKHVYTMSRQGRQEVTVLYVRQAISWMGWFVLRIVEMGLLMELRFVMMTQMIM